MKLPLKNGDQFNSIHYGIETVMGEIKPPHKIKGGVCWTLRGNWYRRCDGVQVTSWDGKIVTIPEFYKLKSQHEYDSNNNK